MTWRWGFQIARRQMIKLFSFNKKKKRAQRELAPQLTVWQRRALEFAGVPPAGLPYATYDEMEKDSMVQTCLGVKKQGVLASEWRVLARENPSPARGEVSRLVETEGDAAILGGRPSRFALRQ